MITKLARAIESIVKDIGEGVFHHSFSSVNTYLSICQLQYYYRYIARLAQERVGVPLVFGSGMNGALLAIDEDLIKGRSPNLERALEVLHTYLQMAFANRDVPVAATKGETAESLGKLGKRMLEAYLSKLPPDEQPLDLERRFLVPLFDKEGNALPRPLMGEVDRWVRLADGSVGIDDWKTSDKRWPESKVKKDDQSTCYYIGGAHILGKRPAFVRYLLLLKTKEADVVPRDAVRTDRDERRFVKKVSQVDNALKSGSFAPNDSCHFCGTCAFRDACSKWQDP